MEQVVFDTVEALEQARINVTSAGNKLTLHYSNVSLADGIVGFFAHTFRTKNGVAPQELR